MKWMIVKLLLLLAPCLIFLAELAAVKFLVKPGRRFLIGFCVFGLVAAAKFTGFRILGGNDFNPELPVSVIVAWGWLESIVWVGFPVGLAAALFAWAVKPFRRLAFPTALTLSVLLATYGMWEGVRVPPVVEREVAVEGLPAAFDGYRLAHLSDIHCSSVARRGKIAAIVEATNGAKPDLIALTGDFVDGLPDERGNDLEPLKDLHAPDGVVASAGNHEGYFRIDEWMPFFRRWGVNVLRDAFTTVRRGDGLLVIAGEDDPAVSGEVVGTPSLDAPAEGCRILLRHRPVGCTSAERDLGIRLQLSGHTHGGAMPIIARFVAAANEGHVRGLYREGRLALHVSPGTGQWAGFPLRFFNPPEITVLILRRAAGRGL